MGALGVAADDVTRIERARRDRKFGRVGNRLRNPLRKRRRALVPGLDPLRAAPCRRYRRLADHLPEQAPCEPTPRQVPPPELADKRAS
jgi:hypothetical protein